MSDLTTRHPTKHVGVYYRLNARGERRYIISYSDSAGKRVWKTVEGQLKDAVQQRNEVTRRLHKGERVIQSKMTVKDLAEDYLKTQTSHLKGKTYATYEYNLDHYVTPYVGAQKVSSVSVDTIAGLVSRLRGMGLSAWTIRGSLTPLARAFAYGKRRGWISHNPVAELDRSERPKGGARQMRILSSDEIQSVLAACTKGYPITAKGGGTYASKEDSAYRLLFTTAIFSGLRLGELLALDWKDVDLLSGTIEVRASKTDAGIREVVIPDFLVQMLASASLRDGEGFVFKTHRGTPMQHRRVNRALEETLTRAKVDHLRFHDLRHTFASLLIGQGEDITYVSDQMGHANPAITLRIYAKLFDPESRRQEARKRMQASFAEVVG